jgi:hypothetical protein
VTTPTITDADMRRLIEAILPYEQDANDAVAKIARTFRARSPQERVRLLTEARDGLNAARVGLAEAIHIAESHAAAVA